MLNREAQASASFKHVLNSIFAIGNAGRAQSKGVSLMLVRMLVGTILLFCGLSEGFGGVLPTPEVLQSAGFAPSLETVALLMAGTSLCLGLFTRIMLLASTVCFGIVFGEGIAAGKFMQTAALMFALSLVFAVKGPGRLSMDALIRRSLMKIEVEVRNTDEIRQAIAAGVDRIMLDNFTPERTREAVELIRREAPGVEIESSGGITFDTLRQYGETGVDFISVGALTHSVKGLDLSFKHC